MVTPEFIATFASKSRDVPRIRMTTTMYCVATKNSWIIVNHWLYCLYFAKFASKFLKTKAIESITMLRKNGDAIMGRCWFSLVNALCVIDTAYNSIVLVVLFHN